MNIQHFWFAINCIYRNLVSGFTEPVPHQKPLGQLSKSDNFGGELKIPEEPDCHDQKTIKNTDYEYDLRSKGVGGFGSLGSRPPTQDGDNEDHDLNQIMEELQNQLGEEKRRIRERSIPICYMLGNMERKILYYLTIRSPYQRTIL
jgi:hypothetical protein